MTRLLRVQDLTIGYGKAKPMVRGIDFDLRPSEILAIVGESGSGKAALALAMAGLLGDSGGRIIQGQMTFSTREGRDIDLAGASGVEMERMRGREIGILFQEPMTTLDQRLTIGRQIEEVFRQNLQSTGTAARQAALAALARVKIEDPLDCLESYPHQLSAEMLQRVVVAIALSAHPRLLIVKEPTRRIDPSAQAQMIAILMELQRGKDLAIIFFAQDLALAAGFADRVAVMRSGQIVEQGPHDEIFDHPHHPYTQYLLRAVPRFDHGRTLRNDHSRPSGPAGTALLTVRDLTIRHPRPSGLFGRPSGARDAVKGLDFDTMAGETLAMVGESGAGKSSAARALSGLAAITGGTLIFSRQPALARGHQVQLISHDARAALNPHMRIARLLEEPLIATRRRLDADGGTIVTTLLERVGLSELDLTRRAGDLSDEDCLRLCLARALVIDPSVLVLDEPVAGLDVSSQARLLELLIKLQNDLGLGYLVLTREMAIAERIAHRVAILQEGRIVEIGRAADLLASPQHACTRLLIAAAPSLDRRPHRLVPLKAQADRMPQPLAAEPSDEHWDYLGDDHRVLVKREARSDME